MAVLSRGASRGGSPRRPLTSDEASKLDALVNLSSDEYALSSSAVDILDSLERQHRAAQELSEKQIALIMKLYAEAFDNGS